MQHKDEGLREVIPPEVLSLLKRFVRYWFQSSIRTTITIILGTIALVYTVTALSFDVAAIFVPGLLPKSRSLVDEWAETYHQEVVTFPFIGLLFYWLRCTRRIIYGLTELLFGIFSMWFALMHTDGGWRQPAVYVPLFGGLYVMIRGLDNIEKALEADKSLLLPLWKIVFYNDIKLIKSEELDRLYLFLGLTPPSRPTAGDDSRIESSRNAEADISKLPGQARDAQP